MEPANLSCAWNNSTCLIPTWQATDQQLQLAVQQPDLLWGLHGGSGEESTLPALSCSDYRQHSLCKLSHRCEGGEVKPPATCPKTSLRSSAHHMPARQHVCHASTFATLTHLESLQPGRSRLMTSPPSFRRGRHHERNIAEH